MNYNVRLSFHYGITIFLSAFLLFQVQPLIGKMILPWFGGSASVWTTCMLFFQVILLFGYVYSHWIVNALTPYKQSLLHIALLLTSLFLLPIVPNDAWKPTGAENPTVQILGLLFISIGLPYFVLSTTGPLIQAWFAREKTGGVPYRLFALSNLGSMLALLAYPIAVEPILPTKWQSYSWSILFACFVVACGLLAWRNRTSQPLAPSTEKRTNPPTATRLGVWVLLAACPSILMVADTSFLTENIAPIPLIWVAPLALYLLSFIFCFEGHRWYRRELFLPLFVIALLTLAYLPTVGLNDLPVFVSMGINLSAFFIVCMVCHGELAAQQPNAHYLTMYFLMIAIGGAIGGFFVGVIAPYWFNENYELSIGIILTGIIVAVVALSKITFKNSSWKTGTVIGIALWLFSLSAIRINDHLSELSGAEVSVRNFYGTLKVFANTANGYRSMRHGQITHGRQLLDPKLVLEPTTYYIRKSGVGRAIEIKNESAQALNVGVIGLGAGTLAGYGRAGDTYKFYEINPEVIKLAKQRFTFLSKTPSKTELVLGDARLQLENEPPQQFDVLVVDAFSGDSVPIHLLTKEAFGQYFRHLKENGVLAIHITNRYLNLKPVVKAAADIFGKQAKVFKYYPSDSESGFRSEWVLISGQQSFFQHHELDQAKTIDLPTNFRLWKDDYSSLLPLIY